jgi:hypothetical protein
MGSEVSKIVFFAADLCWKGEPVKGPDGVIYGEDRDFRLCAAELSKDGKTLTLVGVQGFSSFKGSCGDLTKNRKPVSFTSIPYSAAAEIFQGFAGNYAHA